MEKGLPAFKPHCAQLSFCPMKVLHEFQFWSHKVLDCILQTELQSGFRLGSLSLAFPYMIPVILRYLQAWLSFLFHLVFGRFWALSLYRLVLLSMFFKFHPLIFFRFFLYAYVLVETEQVCVSPAEHTYLLQLLSPAVCLRRIRTVGNQLPQCALQLLYLPRVFGQLWKQGLKRRKARGPWGHFKHQHNNSCLMLFS